MASVAGSSVAARDYCATATGTRPTEDVCNDWTALGGSEVSGVTIVHLKRALDRFVCFVCLLFLCKIKFSKKCGIMLCTFAYAAWDMEAMIVGDMYQDRPFSSGALTVVYAWASSNSDNLGNHGTSNRGIASVSFYGPKPISATSIPGTTSVLVTMGYA